MTTSPQDLYDLVVQLHNEIRWKHKAPPVVLDGRLNQLATAYALAIVHGRNNTDEPDSNIGRNIFQTRIAGGTRNRRIPIDQTEIIRDAIEVWYNGKEEYNWDEPLSSGHHARAFSQLVWKDCNKIGLGIGVRGIVHQVVVLYSPVGNIISDESYRENVSPGN